MALEGVTKGTGWTYYPHQRILLCEPATYRSARTCSVTHTQSTLESVLYVCFGDTLCRVERHWVRLLGARHVTHRCSCAPCPQPHTVDIRVCQWLLLCVCNQRVATKEGMVNRHHRENSERERERDRSLRGEGRVTQ